MPIGRSSVEWVDHWRWCGHTEPTPVALGGGARAAAAAAIPLSSRRGRGRSSHRAGDVSSERQLTHRQVQLALRHPSGTGTEGRGAAPSGGCQLPGQPPHPNPAQFHGTAHFSAYAACVFRLTPKGFDIAKGCAQVRLPAVRSPAPRSSLNHCRSSPSAQIS